MPPRIHTTATITEVLSQRHYHATLPNGKIVIAHYPTHKLGPQLAIGDAPDVRLDVTDFSQAEIIQPTNL